MRRLTPELIKEMLDTFFYGEVEGLFLSEDGDSFCFTDCGKPDYDGIEGTLCGYDYHISMGAFKMCIIFDEFDEVVKIPANASFSSCYNEDTEEYEAVINEWFEDDCIQREVVFYDSLNELTTFDPSIKNFFLPNKFVMFYKGLPIYTQEKIKATFSAAELTVGEIEELRKEYRLDTKGIDVPYTGMNIEFVEQIIRSYKDPFSLLEIISTEVNDLHTDNVGYAFDGRPVCHDYGGTSCC